MASFKAIQSGTAIILSANTSVVVTIPVTVNSTKTFLKFSARTDHISAATGAKVGISGVINLAGTTITFTRESTGGQNVTILWYIVEFTSGVTVQRGTASNVNQSYADTAISAITPAKTWAQCSTHGATSWDYGACQIVAATIQSSVLLRLKSSTVAHTNTVHWEVIEYDTAVVATYNGSMLDGVPTGSFAITAINTAKSFVIGNVYHPTSDYESPNFSTIWLLNASTISWIRKEAYENRTYALQVITIPEISVLHGYKSIPTGDISGSFTLAPALRDYTKAFPVLNAINSHRGIALSVETAQYLLTGSITSNSNITLQRYASGGSNPVEIYFSTIEFFLTSRIPDLMPFALTAF
jgi:hypothetical protein